MSSNGPWEAAGVRMPEHLSVTNKEIVEMWRHVASNAPIEISE